MKKISIIIMVLVVALASCKKTPEVNLKYVDVERDLVTVGMTTANIQCDYDYIATLKEAYFYYGEGENEDNFTAAEMRVVQNTLYVELIGLKPNTTYNYYYEFYNGFNSMRTTLKTFKTEVTPGDVTLPTVITAEVTEITTSSAQCGGEVTNDGGSEVTERGICWSTNANPTLDDSHVAAGSGMGAFNAVMSELEANTTYHVRAYAINERGTAYGLDREFVTIGGGGTGGVPEGAINGLFTINENGDQVYFSQGNLQYQASTNTWRFAEHQWDFVGGTDYSGSYFGNVSGSSNNDISPTYEGWIDLFCWGTSGWDNGNVYYHPYDYERLNEYAGYGYGPTDGTNLLFNLAGTYANADWGIYNAISNGGNQPNQWRTLTFMEWVHLFELRNPSSGIRFAKAVIGGVNGVIVLPDNWDASIYPLNHINRRDAGFGSNVMTTSTWLSVFQANGAVFLSETGHRDVLDYYYSGGGLYWSTTFYSLRDAKGLGIGDGGMTTNSEGGYTRDLGFGVRLVRDKNYSPIPAPELANVFTIEPYSTGSVIVFQGMVEFEGSSPIIERGFYWGTTENPGIADNRLLADEVYPDLFSATFNDWEANTTYHVRAYAINSAGTAYGLDVEFTY